jgi:hypothetical protein
MFGGDGTRHTLDYYNFVRALEAWEVDVDSAIALKRNLPAAAVLNVNSFAQITVTNRTFDLIVADSPTSCFGPDQCFCEHFDFVDAKLFRLLRPSTILILNLLPDVLDGVHTRRVELAQPHLARRSRFYGSDRPGQLSIDEMVATYRKIFRDNGFELEWYFHQLRTLRSQVHYLVLKVRRELSGN